MAIPPRAPNGRVFGAIRAFRTSQNSERTPRSGGAAKARLGFAENGWGPSGRFLAFLSATGADRKKDDGLGLERKLANHVDLLYEKV
jgi:hypothetical protein